MITRWHRTGETQQVQQVDGTLKLQERIAEYEQRISSFRGVQQIATGNTAWRDVPMVDGQ